MKKGFLLGIMVLSFLIMQAGSSFAQYSNNKGIYDNYSILADQDDNIQEDYKLSNYPNPVKSKTTFEFFLEQGGEVKITIYDVLGNQVDIATNEYFAAGKQDFEYDATKLKHGIYIYTFETSGKKVLKRFIKSE